MSRIYTTVQGDMWDMIAYKEMGSVDYTDDLMNANSSLLSYFSFPAGVMLTIPYGKTMTYGEIAAEVARQHGLEKMSAQAVGGAVGHNPISLLIPCHRVVGTNGSLTGYGGGIERKVKLLELEHTDVSGLFVPKKGTAL